MSSAIRPRVHAEGRKARALIEDARERDRRAGCACVRPMSSSPRGATEGAAWVLTPNTRAAATQGDLLRCWPARPSTPACCRGTGSRPSASRRSASSDGVVDLGALEARLADLPAVTARPASWSPCRPPTTRPACCSRPRASPSWRVPPARCSSAMPCSSPAALPCDAEAIGADVLILSATSSADPRASAPSCWSATGCSPSR